MSLDGLLGTWTFTMRHVDVPDPVEGHQRYERVLDGAFVILHWSYSRPEFPDAIALLTDVTCHYFDVRGVTRIFEVSFDDGGWQMIRRDTDFWQRLSARFQGPDAMVGTGENSYDGGTSWQRDFDITYSRLQR